MPTRHKKYHARKGTMVYEKPYRGTQVALSCEASGIIYRESNADNLPSVPITMGIDPRIKTQKVMSEAMKEREAIARVESERRKKMIAPMYNKGAYQYIGGVDPEILHDIGKKK